jgi:DNA-binding response OmpR family regulator
MFRIVLFTPKKEDLSDWHSWLERDFEIAHVTNEETIIPLLQSWAPHIFIYFDTQIREATIDPIVKILITKNIKFVFVAPFYELRSELLAFQFGADHFLLTSSPTESIKARLISMAKKNHAIAKVTTEINLLQLPQQIETVEYNGLVLHANQNIVQIGSQAIRITPTQTMLLLAFFTHAGELLTRQWLIQNIFKNSKITPRTIDAHIAKIKRILPQLTNEIINVYGQGYTLKKSPSKAA